MMIEVIVGFGRTKLLTYINDDRSYCWIWKNKIADVYHIGYVTFMNYISVPSINAKIDEAIAKKKH